MLDIHVRSEGCEDPGKAPGTCGIAYIKVNGVDHSPHRRGHNVVIVDAKTGTISNQLFSDLSFFSFIFPLKSDLTYRIMHQSWLESKPHNDNHFENILTNL